MHKHNIGMLFQNCALFPHLKVAENLAFGLTALRDQGKIAAQVAEGLDLVSLAGCGERSSTSCPAVSSNGSRRRAR